MRTLLLMLMLALPLLGCGQKGPLVLPQDDSAAQESSQPTD